MKGRVAVRLASVFGLLHSAPLIFAPTVVIHTFWKRRESITLTDTAREAELARGIGLVNMAADLAGLAEPTRAMAVVKSVDFAALAVYFLRWDGVHGLKPRKGRGRAYAAVCSVVSVLLGAVAGQARF